MQHSAGRSNSDYLLADGSSTYSLSLQEGCEVAKVHAEGFVYARAQLFFSHYISGCLNDRYDLSFRSFLTAPDPYGYENTAITKWK